MSSCWIKHGGAKDPLTATRGRTQEHLGMTIDFSAKRGVAITQYNFVKKLWLSLPPDLKGENRNAPAPDSLFKLDRNALLLNHDRKDKCHTTAAKLLWISQRSRPDLKLATGFHCSRVKMPTVYD